MQTAETLSMPRKMTTTLFILYTKSSTSKYSGGGGGYCVCMCSLSTLFLRPGLSLSHWSPQARLASQGTPGIFLILSLQHWVPGTCHHAQLLFMWVLGSKLRFLILVWQVLYQLTHLGSPSLGFFFWKFSLLIYFYFQLKVLFS